MLKDIFDSSLLSLSESDEILSGILSEIEMGSDIDDIVLELAGSDFKNNKKLRLILNSISYDIESERYDNLEDIFMKYALIKEDEYILMSHSSSLKKSILEIINIRENGRTFNKWLLKFIMWPALIVGFGLIAQVPLAYFFMDIFYNQIVPSIKKTKSFASTPEFPFYLENTEWTIVFIVAFVFLLLLFATIYIRMLDNSREALYKVSNVLFYDDFYYYFKVIDIMKKADSTLQFQTIFEILSNNTKSKTLKIFFRKLSEREDDFYKEFEKINAPDNVVLKIRRGENYNTLASGLNYENSEGENNGLVWFLKSKRDNKLTSIEKHYKVSLNMLAFTFVFLYIASTVFMFTSAISAMA